MQMNNKYFVKEKLKSILNTWRKEAMYVETPKDLTVMFDAGELVEVIFNLDGSMSQEELYDLCNLVIDEAVNSGVFER